MNRPIKFRAWDKIEKKMHDVIGINFDRGTCVLYHDDGNAEWISDMLLSDVDLLQFIGHLDKNGKEIYEGDIVQWLDGSSLIKGFVVYHKKYACFRIAWESDFKSFKDSGFHGTARFMYVEDNPLKIIGTIFENPELLEQ